MTRRAFGMMLAFLGLGRPAKADFLLLGVGGGAIAPAALARTVWTNGGAYLQTSTTRTVWTNGGAILG